MRVIVLSITRRKNSMLSMASGKVRVMRVMFPTLRAGSGRDRSVCGDSLYGWGGDHPQETPRHPHPTGRPSPPRNQRAAEWGPASHCAAVLETTAASAKSFRFRLVGTDPKSVQQVEVLGTTATGGVA